MASLYLRIGKTKIELEHATRKWKFNGSPMWHSKVVAFKKLVNCIPNSMF